MMKTLKWIAVGLLVAVGAQASIVTGNLAQEFNADDITTVINASVWTARTGANGTLNDNSAVGVLNDLSKVAATVNGGQTSTEFANSLSQGTEASAAQLGAWLPALVGTTMSIELWVSPNADSTVSQTIFETGGNARGMSITLGDNDDGDSLNNNLRFALRSDGVTAFVDTTLSTDFWDGDHHQLVVTYDNVNNMSIYFDGALAASKLDAGVKDWDGGSQAGIWGTDGSGWITTDTLDVDGLGHGSVAVYRHYSDVLTGTEVLQNYTTTIPEPATLGLVVAFGGAIFWIRRTFII